MQFAEYVKWRSEKFGAVIFDTLDEKVHVTNETGKDILCLMEQGLDAPAIIECLQKDYAGEGEQIESEVSAFLNELRAAGFLVAIAEGKP